MSLWFVIIFAGLFWFALVLLAIAVERGPRPDFATRCSWVLARVYVRLWHRLRIEGLEHVPTSGPAVLIANHTAGVDPILIQSACTVYIRWMMMREMMISWADPLWNWLDIIAVEQDGRDSTALRSAIRHLQSGGIVGVFPEGGIERPPETIMPFQPGVGLLALRPGASVLPVVITGTPRNVHAFVSLLVPSRATIRFLPPRTYAGGNMSAPDVARDLQQLFARELAWPVSTEFRDRSADSAREDHAHTG